MKSFITSGPGLNGPSETHAIEQMYDLTLDKIQAQRCIRMGITIFKKFILGGIWLIILSEILFYGSAHMLL